MTLTEFLILLLIAGVVGLIGQLISGFFIGGLFISIIVGFVGALIGVRLADALGLPEWLVITVGTNRFRSSGQSSARRYSRRWSAC